MGRKEFLAEALARIRAKQAPSKQIYYSNPSTAFVEPFRIADGLYYVGDKKVCVHLIDTGEGLILLDAGFPCATHLLVESIWRLGFDPRDVRWILHTHGHFDHFGASEEFRRLYGTKLAIARVEAESLREHPGRAHMNASGCPHAKIPEFDRELEDGEVFTLGNTSIRCVLTPGHSVGVLSFFFDVTDGGKTYPAGLFGGAGVNAISLAFMADDERMEDDCPQEMLDGIDRVWDEPVVIHLGNHPGNNHTLEKREQQIREGGNPFIDPDSWQAFLEKTREQVHRQVRKNEAMEAEMDALFGTESTVSKTTPVFSYIPASKSSGM